MKDDTEDFSWGKNRNYFNLKDIHFFQYFSLLTIFIIIMTIVSPINEATSSSGFDHSQYPPRPPEVILDDATHIFKDDTVKLALPPLKAVLLVGPIDGNDGSWTKAEIANMELAAQVLIKNGVEVHRFYPGSGTFEEIENAAIGAHFLLYRGHGVYDGNLPYPNVGGFYLSSGYYSAERIQTELHLATNAIVMLYGCFTAGSSSAEGDEYDIGITEASRRVAQYSAPFFHVGASGYYANWFGNAFEKFLTNLFAGQSLGSAYENYFDFNAQTVYRTYHPDFPSIPMWVDKDNWDYWKYNNAFVGLKDKKLTDLFKPVTLGGIPSSLNFKVDAFNEIIIEPISYTIQPINLNQTLPIIWSISSQEGWLSVAPMNGNTPLDTFTVSPIAFDTSKPGHYSGVVTINAEKPYETINPSQEIFISLDVLLPELGGIPEILRFYYSIPDQQFLNSLLYIRPENTGSTHIIEWEVEPIEPWIVTFPENGLTPGEISVSLTNFDTSKPGFYEGSLIFTATVGAIPVYNSPLSVPVSVIVSNDPINKVYLPILNK
jgi:hypothetical protein